MIYIYIITWNPNDDPRFAWNFDLGLWRGAKNRGPSQVPGKLNILWFIWMFPKIMVPPNHPF